MQKLKISLHNFVRTVRDTPFVALVAVLCVSGFALFMGVAGEVLEGESLDLDKRILMMMRNPADISDPLGPPWLEEMMRDMTALGGVAVVTLMTLACFGYLMANKRRAEALYVLAAISTGIAFSSILKFFFHRPRPNLFPHGSIVYTSSFPSGHSLMSALTYLTLGALLAEAQTKRGVKIYIQSLSIFITALIGVSRVYLGVHWPSDVLAGWLAGSAWAMLTWLVWTRVLHHSKKKAG